MTNAFTTKVREHARRAWKCKGKCCTSPKILEASDQCKWNNATKMQCTEAGCNFKPNTSCILWKDGLGVNGGKWRKDNEVPPTDSPPPSKQTPAGKAATDKRAADKQVEKLRKEKEKAEKDAEAMRQDNAKLKAGLDTSGGGPPSSSPPAGDQGHTSPDLRLKLTALEKCEKRA